MRYVFPEINHVFDTETDKVCTLIIENQRLFLELVTDIRNQIDGYDGQSVLSLNGKQHDAGKLMELITEFVPFCVANKSVITKIIARLEKRSIQDDFYPKTVDLIAEIEHYLESLAFELSGDITFTKVNVGTLLKAVGVDVDLEGLSLPDKILNFMELVREYDRDKLFVFVNLRSYISDDDAEKLFETIICHQYNVLIVESFARKPLYNETRYIIDSDLCEIG